jgi:probable F420-dependent oxidoreductase
MNAAAPKTSLGRLGIWSPELRGGSAAGLDAAAELDQAGWGAIWLPAGANRRSMWDDAGDLLAHAPRLSVAFGVMSIWGDDAARASESHSALVARYGPRLLTGLGVSSPALAASNGKTYTTPLRAMNDYLDSLDHEGVIQADDRILGALGPKMVALGAERAAGVHSFLVTPESNEASRRIVGPDKFIAPYLAVTLETDPRRARDTLRRFIGAFIGFPTYQANLRRLGFGDDDLIPGGSDRLIDAVTAWGTTEQIAAKIADHIAAGADHVALNVVSAESGLPLREWRELGSLLQESVLQR